MLCERINDKFKLPAVAKIPQSPFQSSLSCRPFSYQREPTLTFTLDFTGARVFANITCRPPQEQKQEHHRGARALSCRLSWCSCFELAYIVADPLVSLGYWFSCRVFTVMVNSVAAYKKVDPQSAWILRTTTWTRRRFCPASDEDDDSDVSSRRSSRCGSKRSGLGLQLLTQTLPAPNPNSNPAP